MTDVRHALAHALQDQDALAKAAVNYVQTSAPDALVALKPRQQLLVKIAEAMLEGRLTRDDDFADSLRDESV